MQFHGVLVPLSQSTTDLVSDEPDERIYVSRNQDLICKRNRWAKVPAGWLQPCECSTFSCPMNPYQGLKEVRVRDSLRLSA